MDELTASSGLMIATMMMVNIIIIAIIMVIDYDYYGMTIIIITRKKEANALYKNKSNYT